ncbi:MAG: outer membrane lipoprotein chaperone LolA [Arsenophonus sp. ER-EMS1-MAG3]
MIKKVVTLLLSSIIFYTNQILAGDVSVELQKRLNKINGFYANFSQKVTMPDGSLMQEAEGQLWIKHPSLFNWHMISPDEILLISDGTNFWFYNPLINQVTITLVSNVIFDIPFILIASNNPKNWNSYKITQNGNNFLLKMIENNGYIKCFSISIQPNGTVQQFSITDQNGQINSYYLKNHKNNYFDKNKFKFIPPQGVTIDDQR